MKHCLIPITVFAGIIAVSSAAYIYYGLYDIGADAPHWFVTTQLIETLRERSIEVRARDIETPNLKDLQLALKGAAHYDAMCMGCHLAPGVRNTEIRLGLYPKPPDLSKAHVDPKAAFWVVKHGIKMTGMPAWGKSHDDNALWSIVAFLNRLPEMTPQEYKAIVAKAQAGNETTPMEAHGEAQDAHGHGHSHASPKHQENGTHSH
ncbi:MAG: cytochrome c [Nitrosospira sp.]|nr:cytochrome c [Nitrosospira sp.]